MFSCVQNDIMAKEEIEKADINRFSDKQKRTERENYYLEKFMNCRQKEFESVTSFASRLKDLGREFLKTECTQLDLVIQFKKGVIRDIYKKICLTETDDFDILVQNAKQAEEYLSKDRNKTRYSESRDREVRYKGPRKSNVLKERSSITNALDCFKYPKDSKKPYIVANREEIKKALNELEIQLDSKQFDWLSREVIAKDNGQHNGTTRNRHLKRLIKAILKS